MKKKILIGVLVLACLGIILFLTHARSWYTYDDGCTEKGYNIFGVKYTTNKCNEGE